MIEVEKTALLDLLVVKPTILEDHRGTFLDIYYLDGYLENGVDVQFVRDAISTSTKNVLRGIHYRGGGYAPGIANLPTMGIVYPYRPGSSSSSRAAAIWQWPLGAE
jgi:dTDP-4-dehydrorhamnose 3,5-epimerase-like enzyme